MTQTPLTLAALASAAVPGLFPVAAYPIEVENPEYTSALVLDSARQRWTVRSPRHLEASLRLESEHVILHSFSPGLRARLPFQLPTVVGSADRDGLKTFVYPQIPGEVTDIEEFVRRARSTGTGRDALAAQVGRVMATVHTLPTDLVQEADLPSYTPEQSRRRLFAEVDRAAATRKIPRALLRRWEGWLEDDALWRFRPTVVHGNFSEDSMVLDGGRVAAVRDWQDLQVGDPATDFAWLMSCPDQGLVDTVVEVYTVSLPHAPDRHLIRRAYLHAEFALAQWLVSALEQDDFATVDEAQDMLEQLERDLKESGDLAADGTTLVPVETETAPAAGASAVGTSTPEALASEPSGPVAASSTAAPTDASATGRPAAHGSTAAGA